MMDLNLIFLRYENLAFEQGCVDSLFMSLVEVLIHDWLSNCDLFFVVVFFWVGGGQHIQIRASKAEAKVGWTHQPPEEKDYSNCDLEMMSQSLILPPTDRPYFLLLQGYDQSKARHAQQMLSRSQTAA